MSTRDTVLDGFKQMGLSITTANGYDIDIVKCERKFTFWDQIMDYPHMMVLGGDERFEDDLGDTTNSWMDVKIKGYSKDPDEPEEALCILIANIMKALNSSHNPHLGKTIIDGVQTDEGWLNSESLGLGMFQINARVLYKFNRSSP